MSWILPILLPLMVAGLLATPAAAISRRFLVPLVPLPALWLALTAPADASAEFGPLVLGLRLGFGPAGQIFLLFTALLWLVAGIYRSGYFVGDRRGTRFDGFYLLTMTGNIGLILARDVPAFYTFFAMMTFSGYGLVIHTETAAARRAARIYLITAVIGEALLLGAMVLAVAAADSAWVEDLAPAVADSDSRDLILFLALFGFGVKAGLLPLHFWLPLAHPVAPAPASAVLSGAMIKAGLLGWMHFLPLGHGEFPAWSVACVILGVLAAFGAVLVGCTQDDPKTALAYSSISQMGVMTVGIGIGLAGADAWAATLPVLLLYALNHALAKGALFFGAGIAHATGRDGSGRWLVAAGLGFAALVIAGAPWTGGAIAKNALKAAAAGVPGAMIQWLDWLLPLTAVGTSLLLGRFLWLVMAEMRSRPQGQAPLLMWLPWLALLVASALAVGFAMRHFGVEAGAPGGGSLWKAAWPILLSLGMLLILSRFIKGKAGRLLIPQGDVVIAFEWMARWLGDRWRALPGMGPSLWKINFVEPLERLAESERRRDFASRLEQRLRHGSVPGILFVLLGLGLVALMLFGNTTE
jgi:formate hydrogenlyase subunit 3/multisubunit Na+/H+ antiporter MnhD subunit